MAITPEMARAELARRELERRKANKPQNQPDYSEEYGQPKEIGKGFSGILNDIGQVPGKIIDYASDLPNQAGLSIGQLINKPGRALKNLGAGVGEAAIGAVNLPYNIAQYLKKKDIPYFKQVADYAPHIGNLGVEKAVGLGDEQPGDKLLREAAAFAGLPKVPGIGKVTSGIKNLTKNIKEIPKKGQVQRDIEGLESQHQQASQTHGANEEEYGELKNFLERQPEFRTGNPNTLQRKAAEQEAQLGNLKSQQQSQAGNLENYEQSANLLKTNEQKGAEIEGSLGKYLKKGAAHDLPVAEKVVETIRDRKKDIGKVYDEVENTLKDENVLIPRTDQLANAEKEAREVLEKSKGFFRSDDEYEKAVQKIAKADNNAKNRTPNDIVPASEVLSNYRTLRNLSQNLRKQAYSRKVAGNKDLQAEILGKADEFEESAGNLEKILESNDLGTSLTTLKKANSRWRTEIIPLYKNSTYQMFLNKGLGPPDIIKALRGKGSGQEIIRDIIKKDPELLKNVLGQRYASNPAKLHEFDELTSEYLEKLPELKNMSAEHRKALQDIKISKENLDKIPNSAQAYKVNEEIARIEKDLPRIKEYIKELQEKSNKKNISLKEKMAIESKISSQKKRLSKIEKNRASLKKWGKRGAYIGAGVIFGEPFIDKLLSKATGNSNQ